MLSGRRPGWLLLLAAACSAGLIAVPSASAQTPPVSPTIRPEAVAPPVARPSVEPSVRLPRGCALLPDLAGRNLDEVLPKLSPDLFRPRVKSEPSSQPRGTILRQPTTQLIEGRLCYLDIAVSDGSLTRAPQRRGETADEAERALARAAAAAARAVAPRPQEPAPVEQTCRPLPDLAGRQVDEALRMLARRSFRPRVSEEPSTEPQGTILRQPTTEPIDGSLCYADIAISDGSLTRVPPLRGATVAEAERAAAEAGLRIAIRESVSNEPAGRVFDQKPSAGEVVRRRSTVAALIALPQLFDVPDVVGLPYREAARRLEPFTVSREVVRSRLPSGQVVDQDPRPPAQRPAGAEIRLVVSDGSLVLVPRVERGTLESARAVLGEVELRVEVDEQEGELAPGIVATQEPAAGAEVPRGSTVRVAVSTGLPVPDVVGRAVGDAATVLDRFEVEQSAVPSREPEGQVIDQSPRPPARAAAGTIVRLSVSDGSRLLVPPVAGVALASAREVLAESGLQAEVEEQDSELEPGLVATQAPDAGTEVLRGSIVRLVVSRGLPPAPVVDRPIEPPADDTELGTRPVKRVDGDGIRWSRWLTYLVALLAASGLFYAVRLRLRPPPAEPRVSARLESDLGSVEITDVGLAGPAIQVSARLDAGHCEVRLEGDRHE